MTNALPLSDYGLTSVWRARFDFVEKEDRAELGRVIRQDRGFVLAACESGVILAAVRPKSPPVLVGDWVVVQDESVHTTLDRDTVLVRKDAHANQEQPLVANVDVVFIVCGVDRPVSIHRIERASTQAWKSGATPVVVLSKADLIEDVQKIENEVAEAVGVEVLSVASKRNVGLDKVRGRMQGHTSVLLGESGAGKSTMVNALLGNEISETGEVREGDSKGRHTTTRRELHLTPSGILIDTPGIRALGLWADEESIAATFPEVAEAADMCRFTNCTHDGEPGCAIDAALKVGDLLPARVDAWMAQLEEVQENIDKETENMRRKRDAKKTSRVVRDALKRKGRHDD